MWAFGQEYLSLNISNTLALGMGLNSGLDYIYCARILNGGCSPIAPYLYSIYVCGVHARGGHCMSSSFFGSVIFCAPSVYSFSHGVDFFLDFFFGFSICFASFDRKRLLLEVNSTYCVDVQKEEPTASSVYSFEGIYSN